jgi:hypothetical protein
MSLEDLIQQSNLHIHSFKILIDTPFLKQCNDTEFKETSYIAKKEDIYDGIIVLKRDNKNYLDVGCDLFIEIQFTPLNMTLFQNKIK